MNAPITLTVSEARSALVDILSAFQSPANLPGLEAARTDAGNDMVKQMQIVFPAVTRIQAQVISRYGFTPDGEGVVQFIQHIKQLEREDPEIERLHSMVKVIFSKKTHSRPENLKRSRPKKLVKLNKSISRKFFLAKFIFFCNFKNSQKSIFELEKCLKLSKMQFYERKN